MFGYWLPVLHQCTTNVQMFGYWILVLHCTTSGADGGAAKFAFQHSTVSPLQVSQQVIIICNTLNDNYIPTSWIIFVVYFSFLQLWNHLKVWPALETVSAIRVSADLHFLSTPARNPLPPSPRPARNGNERMSFFCWFYPQCPPPSQQTTHPAMPVLSLFCRAWPKVTTQYDCDHTVRLWIEPSMIPRLVKTRAVTVFSPRTKWLNSWIIRTKKAPFIVSLILQNWLIFFKHNNEWKNTPKM